MGVKNAFLGRVLGSADTFSDEQVAQTINLLVEHAIKHDASDIHIEPHERHAQVRYRIDNALRATHKLPLAALPVVISQIKELAGLSSSETQLPQEGQYSTLVGETQFEIQVYTMPVIGGEKVVLHILRRLTEPLDLPSLGYWGDGLAFLQQTLARTHGLIVVATPRRNGRTTTLHSILHLVNIPALSVATVERSLEFRVPGASQTLTRPERGMSFAEGLQAALNQDPNVVMLSDLEDKKTAALSVRAAAGGHLLLAGMHADNAAAAVAALQHMTDEKFLLSGALRVVVSQRLARALCPNCRQAYTPSREEMRQIEETFGIRSAAGRAQLHELEQAAMHAGVGGRSHTLHTSPAGILRLWQPDSEGCEMCNHTGFRGSVAITEVLPVAGTSLQQAILKPITGKEIEYEALKQGFKPMRLDGLIKALRGQTAISELVRLGITSPELI